MTIPSLGGNNSNFNINIKRNIQPNLSELAPEQEISDIGAGCDIKTSDVPESKNSEDEYSIENFRQDYKVRLENDVIPVLQAYEGERKKRFKFAVIIVSILVIAGLLIYFFVSGRTAGELAGACFSMAVVVWLWIKKTFEKKVKRKIMPMLMKAFNGFYWQETPPISHDELCSINIFPKINNAVKSFDDCFVGKYRNVSLNLSECSYETGGKHSMVIFKGAVIKLKMNKKFEGVTIIRPKRVGLDDVSDLKKMKMQLISLEDVEFNNEYYVYSTNQIEARYLITTSFMERFKNISLAFSSNGKTFCAFYGDFVYIAPYCRSDLFNLFGLTQPVAETTQFSVLFEEFVSILELVDHFKLDKKLGL